MTPTDENIDRIEDFLSGRMNAAEEAAFRREMIEDADLRETVEDYEVLYKGFRQKRMEEFGNKIAAFRKQLEAEEAMEPENEATEQIPVVKEPDVVPEIPREPVPVPVVIPIWRRRIVQWAVAAVVLFAFAWMWWYFAPTGTYAGLAEEFFQTQDFTGVKGGSFGVALNTFESGNYQEAIKELRQLVKEEKAEEENYHEAQLLLGFAYFETGKYAKAVKAFQAVSGSEDQLNNLFIPAAVGTREIGPYDIDWRLMLALYADGQDAKANEMLARLTSEPNPYDQEASEFKKKMAEK